MEWKYEVPKECHTEYHYDHQGKEIFYLYSHSHSQYTSSCQGKKEAYPETQRDRKQQCIKSKIRSDVVNGGAEVKYFECIYRVETDWDL